MANAVKKTEEKQMTTIQSPMTPMELKAAEMASHQEVVASDVLIPRLLLMQGISPLVSGRKAQIGDMIRSTTVEKLGDPEHPLEIVPLRMVNSWISFETAKSAGTTAPAFRGQTERNASNEQLEWDYTGPNGEEMFRRKAITLYALVPADVQKYNDEIKRAMDSGEAPDLNRTVLPVVLTFQSTSFKHAGKKCASFFNNVRVNAQRIKGLAPFQYVLPLVCREEKKGTQSWYVYDLNPPKPLKDAAIREEAARWATIINAGNVKVDTEGEVAEASGPSAGEMEV